MISIRQLLHIAKLFLFILIIGYKNFMAQDISRPENIKAVFIYNFTKFLEWPETTDSTFKIGILGESMLVKPLQEIAEQKKIAGKKIEVILLNEKDDYSSLKILFIDKIISEDLQSILNTVKNNSVLTIGHEAGLAKKGIAINFVKKEGKIRFEINLEALEKSGIKTDTRLLRLGIVL